MLPQWHVKDPGYFAKSVGGRLHLNVHTPLTQRSRSGLTMPLSRHSVGTYQETSSHATHQATLSHSRLRSRSHCGLILAQRVEILRASYIPLKKKKKKAGAERMVDHSSKIIANEDKVTTNCLFHTPRTDKCRKVVSWLVF